MRLALPFLAIALAAPVARAESPELERARRLKAELQYSEARAALDAALGRGGASPAELASIHQLAGEISAGLGDEVAAEDHFAVVLALEPDAVLPPGASPKIRGPFERARARLAGRALTARHAVDERVIEVVVDDPLELAAGARAEILGGGEVRAEGRPPYRLAIPGEGPARVVLAVLDGHGNQLAVLGSAASPIEVGQLAAPPPAPERPPEERGLHARPMTWAIGGGALAIAGGVFALLARDAQSDLDELSERARRDPFSVDFAEAAAIERRGDRYALAANVGFAAAAGAGVAAALLWWLGDGDPAPAVTAGGDAVTAGIRARF